MQVLIEIRISIHCFDFRDLKKLIQNKTSIDLLVASAKDDVVAITLEGRYKICCRHTFLYMNYHNRIL